MLVQQHLEACIWCTTYNFFPRVVKKWVRNWHLNDKTDMDRMAGDIIQNEEIELPDFGPNTKKLFDLLTSHFIADPNTGRTYSEIGP